MRHLLAAVTALLVASSVAGAQEAVAAPAALGICRDTPCRVIYDWGSGASPASYGADRRYGPAADIEPLFKAALSAHGLRIVESGEGAMLLTVRIKMTRAMCDQMPGTSTDMSCQTTDELMIQYSSGDPAIKAPSAMRIANRCGAGDTKMTVAQMANFAADYVSYQLAADKKGHKKAVSRC